MSHFNSEFMFQFSFCRRTFKYVGMSLHKIFFLGLSYDRSKLCLENNGPLSYPQMGHPLIVTNMGFEGCLPLHHRAHPCSWVGPCNQLPDHRTRAEVMRAHKRKVLSLRPLSTLPRQLKCGCGALSQLPSQGGQEPTLAAGLNLCVPRAPLTAC